MYTEGVLEPRFSATGQDEAVEIEKRLFRVVCSTREFGELVKNFWYIYLVSLYKVCRLPTG